MYQGPIRPDITGSQDLSAGALSVSITMTRPRSLSEVLFSIDGNITEAYTIVKQTADGTNYSLDEGDFIAEDSASFRPQGKCDFQMDDKFLLACTQANATGTVTYHVKTTEIYQN